MLAPNLVHVQVWEIALDPVHCLGAVAAILRLAYHDFLEVFGVGLKFESADNRGSPRRTKVDFLGDIL